MTGGPKRRLIAAGEALEWNEEWVGVAGWLGGGLIWVGMVSRRGRAGQALMGVGVGVGVGVGGGGGVSVGGACTGA